METEFIDIVFDGPPDLQAGAGRFVEVEDSAGRSIRIGKWIEDPGGKHWRLRIRARQLQLPERTDERY